MTAYEERLKTIHELDRRVFPDFDEEYWMHMLDARIAAEALVERMRLGIKWMNYFSLSKDEKSNKVVFADLDFY